MGALQPLQVITRNDLKLIEGFIEDFLWFSRNRTKSLRDIEKRVERCFDEVTESLKSVKAKVKFRAYLKSEFLDFESRESYMLEASLKDFKMKLYLSVYIPLTIVYNDRTYSPGLVYIELFKSYPGQLTGGVLKSLLPVRRDEFRGEAVSVLLIHGDALRTDRGDKLLALLLASNPVLLGFRDNVVLMCRYNRGKFIASRASILIPFLVVFYHSEEEWRRGYEHTEQISCMDLFPHLNLNKISRIEYKAGPITLYKDEKGFAAHVDETTSEEQRNQNTT